MSPSVSARLLLTQSDARLVAFARAGHERAFEALVRRYRGPLLGYCRRLLLSEERAEDALQQALMQAWLALRAGTEVQNAKAWLYRIVHNSALNALRVSGYDYCTLSESLSGADAPQEDLDRRIAVREALAGLAALPEMQREALLRTAVEGSSHREAARELGLSEPALRGLVYRARAALRAAAGAFVPGPVVSWALGAGGGSGTPVGERVAEVGIGGGSAGVAGLLMKGGAMAVTAGVLAGGIAAVHVHPRHVGKHGTLTSARVHTHRETVQVALASARTASVRPVTDAHGTSPATVGARATHRSRTRARGTVHRRHRGRAVTGVVVAGAPAWPSSRDGGGDRRGAGGRHDGSRDQNASAAGGSGGADVRGGVGSPDGGGQGGSSGEGPGSGNGEGGSLGGQTKGGSPEGGRDGGGGGDGQGEGSTGTTREGEQHGDRGSSGTVSTNSTIGEQGLEGEKRD